MLVPTPFVNSEEPVLGTTRIGTDMKLLAVGEHVGLSALIRLSQPVTVPAEEVPSIEVAIDPEWRVGVAQQPMPSFTHQVHQPVVSALRKKIHGGQLLNGENEEHHFTATTGSATTGCRRY